MTDIIARPNTLALTTTTYEPTVEAPRAVTPITASLTTATYSPLVRPYARGMGVDWYIVYQQDRIGHAGAELLL